MSIDKMSFGRMVFYQKACNPKVRFGQSQIWNVFAILFFLVAYEWTNKLDCLFLKDLSSLV